MIDDVPESLASDLSDEPECSLGDVVELPESPPLLSPLIDFGELATDSLSLAWLGLLVPLGNAELGSDCCDDAALDSSVETALELPCDSPLLTADDAIDVSESCEDDNADGGRDEKPELPDESVDGWLEPSFDCDDALGRDDRLGTLDEVADSLDRSSEDGDWLDCPFDADERDESDGDRDVVLLSPELLLWLDSGDELASEDSESELLERVETLLSDDGLLDGCEDPRDDLEEDARLRDAEDFDEPDLLSALLDESPDEKDRELRDPDDGLLGELVAELPEEPLERERLLESELRRLLLGLRFEELSTELDSLLSDESLDEMGDDRDDSLTLENDLLDP